MPTRREILKIGLATTADDRLLVVKKRHGSLYILPGGKPESGETDIEALDREIDEELGCRLDLRTIIYLGSFSDIAADLQDTTVTVRLYGAQLIGNPAPRAEIENLKWFSPSDDALSSLAPSLQNHILPFLFAEGRLSATARGKHVAA